VKALNPYAALRKDDSKALPKVNEKDDDLFTNLSSDVTIVIESISAPDTLPVDIGGTNCEDVSGDNLRHFLSEGVSYRSP
jgi:hypothetical protein